MPTAKVWSSVGVSMQSALSTAVTINSISKANPGVVGYTGTDPVNGDFVYLQVQGMSQMDERVVRVANVNGAGNTFELEGVDTTAFDTFTSGTFQVITFGTTLATLTDLSASGGDFDFIDVTTIHDNVKKQIPGASNPATYSFGSIWDVSDAGLIALKVASDAKAKRAFRFTFADSHKLLYTGFVGATLLPVGNSQDRVNTPVVITMFGRPTTYSS